MLARLSSIAGVASSSVDVTGRTFIVELAAVEDRERVVGEVEHALGAGSRRLAEPWSSAETERLDGEGDLWLDIGSVRRLSLIEARMLSSNWGSSAAAAAGLDPGAADHLVMALRRELGGEFERVHNAGGTTDRRWYVRAFPGACDRAIRQLSGEISPVQASTVRELLVAAVRE